MYNYRTTYIMFSHILHIHNLIYAHSHPHPHILAFAYPNHTNKTLDTYLYKISHTSTHIHTTSYNQTYPDQHYTLN